MSARPFLVDRLITWLWPWGRRQLEALPHRRQIFIWLVVIGVFWSSFSVWRQERDERVSVEGERNNIRTLLGGKQQENDRQNNEIESLKVQLQTARDTISRDQRPIPPPSEPKKYVCTTKIAALTPNRNAVLFEFGIRGESTNGFVTTIVIDQNITKAEDWMGQPLRTDLPTDRSGVTADNSREVDQKIFKRQFSSPSISPNRSEYVYIETEGPITIKGILYLEDFNVLADQVKAMAMAQVFSPCPR